MNSNLIERFKYPVYEALAQDGQSAHPPTPRLWSTSVLGLRTSAFQVEGVGSNPTWTAGETSRWPRTTFDGGTRNFRAP